jgi:hypothetical protein
MTIPPKSHPMDSEDLCIQPIAVHMKIMWVGRTTVRQVYQPISLKWESTATMILKTLEIHAAYIDFRFFKGKHSMSLKEKCIAKEIGKKLLLKKWK